MFRIRQNAPSIVVCVVGCALLVLTQRSLPDPVGSVLVSVIFMGTVLVAGVIGGGKAGIAATTLGFFSAIVFFSPPILIRVVSNPVELLRLLPYAFLGMALSAICEMLQRAWRRIAERQRQLEEEVRERRRAQEAEQFRADEMMTTLASIGEGVMRIDSKGRVTFLNPVAEEMVGWKNEEAVGQPLDAVFHIVNESTRNTVENPATTALREGVIVGSANHTVLVAKDGTERVIDNSAAPIRSRFGEIVGCVLIFRDITERKRAEAEAQETTQELARSNVDLQQFAYVASHDLQEPLRAVSGCVQILEKRYKGQLDAGAAELIGHTVDGVSRMQTLISDLLAYSRVGTRGKKFGKIDCNDMLKSALANLAVAVTESGAVITQDELPTISGDGAQLTQVFQNLVGNAIKFRGADRPEIHIGVQHQDGDWIFSLKDNGIGIRPDHFERIFVIFQRLHTRKDYPGTGIGLAICKKIVERHGGRIWVESESGQGSTFFFTIPAG